jgi:hypothetical protein
LVDTGTFGRLNSLFHDNSNHSDSEFTAIASSIDTQITKAMLSAERKCKKPLRQPWSEEVHFASLHVKYCLHVKYWRLKGASARNQYDASDTLAAILPLLPSKHAITEDPTLTDKQHLNAAYRLLTRPCKDAKSLHADFLQELRERITLRKTPADLDLTESLKCIDKTATTNEKKSHIKKVLCPSNPAPLTEVTVTTTEQYIDPATGKVTFHTTVEVVDTKAALEARILARNKKHFAQAQGTTFTEEPFLSMTPDSLGNYFDSDGQPINLPDGAFKETITVLSLLCDAFADRPPGIASKVSFDDFIDSFLHWNELTFTSPSGRHLRLYKSLVTAHCDSGKEFQEVTDDALSIQTQVTGAVLDAIHRLSTGVAACGLYLLRWLFVVNAMIYKKPGVLELDELRVINLFEADFNLLVVLIFGRRTIHNAVDHQRLHANQFGKKGGKYMDAAISKTLHNIIATYTKTPLAQFESNAAACFDRIVMAFAMLCFYAYWCPMILIRFWLGVLTHHCHEVKTSHGISSGSYSSTPESPIHGSCQGSRGGPGTCVMSTSVLLYALDQLAKGAIFSDPSQTRLDRNTAMMFIDDNTSASMTSIAGCINNPRPISSSSYSPRTPKSGNDCSSRPVGSSSFINAYIT